MANNQKELIDSYFHARKTGVRQDNYHNRYKTYELTKEAVVKDQVDLSLIEIYSSDEEYFLRKLFRDDIALLLNKMNYDRVRKFATVTDITNELLHNPEAIKNINWEKIKNNEIYPFDIAYIISNIPTYFDDDFFKLLDGELITQLITKKPNLINKVDYNKMSVHDVARLLQKHPQLIKYLKGFIPKMDDMEIMHLIEAHPELKKYFKEYNKEYGYG